MGEYTSQVWFLKQNDTRPAFKTQLKNPDGSIRDLTNSATRTHIIKLSNGTVLKRSLAVLNPPGVDGFVTYVPIASDWDVYSSGGLVGGFVPGPVPPLPVVDGVVTPQHLMEYEVIDTDGGKTTHPNNGYDILRIYPDLETVASAPPAIEAGAVLLESGPNTKISALTDGAPALSTDQIVIARSGVSRRLTVANSNMFGLADRFPGVEYVYYGPAKAGKAAPTGPEIVLTAAQVRASNTTPQTIISAVADRVILPRWLHARKEAGAAGFVAGANTGIQFRLGSGTGQQVLLNQTLATARFDQATEEAHLWVALGSGALFGAINLFNSGGLITQNQPLVLFGATANMTSDGSPVHFSVLAELWPVVLA